MNPPLTHPEPTAANPSSAGSSATWKVTVAYNGAPFSGFARQPGQRTVQGELEQALSTMMRRSVEVVCAGRTDAGVHALGQVVSFGAHADDLEPRVVLRSLNALCGDEIAVRSAELTYPDFSARFDAVAREYRYRIVDGGVSPIFLQDFAWWVKTPLDIEAMSTAAESLLGEHDFASFCKASSAIDQPTMRFLELVMVERAVHLGEECIEITVIGNAFLHSMVRTIVGTLVEVGTGRREISYVKEALDACDRTAAGPNAPAHGLTLHHVRY